MENLTVSNKRVLTDDDITLVHIVAEMESPLTPRTRNHLMGLEIFHLTLNNAVKITASIDEKVILKPSGKLLILSNVRFTNLTIHSITFNSVK